MKVAMMFRGNSHFPALTRCTSAAWIRIVAVFVFLVSAFPLFAQTTNTIDGVATNADNGGAQFIIGSNTAFNVLIITNAGTVTDTAGIIGLRSTAPSNSVTVTGTGSIWTNTSTLTIGQTGSVNQLTISAGGVVLDTSGILGLVAASGTNSATVTGSGSIWSNSATLKVGGASQGNKLTISSSGAVYSAGIIIGANGANNNQVLVTDTGTVWASTDKLAVGANPFNANTDGSSGNQLVISNGAMVATSGNSVTVGNSYGGGNIGGGETGPNAAANNNTVTVTGSGSVWTNIGGIYVGRGVNNKGNQLIITNGGIVYATGGIVIGGSISDNNATGDSSNNVTVAGMNSTLFNSGAALTIGAGRAGVGNMNLGNSLVITNSGVVNNGGQIVSMGGGAGWGVNGNLTVTGNGSVLTNAGQLLVGNAASSFGNQVTISAGGKIYSGSVSTIGNANGANNNTVTVTDTGSVWQVGATGTGQLLLGNGAGATTTGNQLIISNGAGVVNGQVTLGLGSGNSSVNNTVTVTDPGSTWTNSSANGASYLVALGNTAGGQTVKVLNGGLMYVRNTSGLLGVAIGNNAGVGNNSVLVDGSGSLLDAAGNAVLVGTGAGPNNTLTITNGGQVVASSVTVGNGGGNAVTISDGGLLEANTLTNIAGATVGSISNVGGIYQFTLATPTIGPSGAGNIALSNGVVSFRNVAAANVFADVAGSGNQLANMSFTGTNAFRLNNSSNATGVASYTFDPSVNPTSVATNYARLELVSGGTLWRSANLTIGAGGSFLASNTVGTVAAAFTNQGGSVVMGSTFNFASNVVVNSGTYQSVQSTNSFSGAVTIQAGATLEATSSKMTFSNVVTISGKYKSDPSTNTFFADMTVSQSGALAGGKGDLFDFKKSLLINSTNRIDFQLATSAVKFSGGGMHTNAITGADLGSNAFAFAVAYERQTNFAYGELHLETSSDQICFTCGVLPAPGVTNNALYIGWLDLLGNLNLVTNLHAASGINLYYNQTDARNGYLNGATYSLTDCNFGTSTAQLIPIIPEPSVLVFLFAASMLFCQRGRR